MWPAAGQTRKRLVQVADDKHFKASRLPRKEAPQVTHASPSSSESWFPGRLVFLDDAFPASFLVEGGGDADASLGGLGDPSSSESPPARARSSSSISAMTIRRRSWPMRLWRALPMGTTVTEAAWSVREVLECINPEQDALMAWVNGRQSSSWSARKRVFQLWQATGADNRTSEARRDTESLPPIGFTGPSPADPLSGHPYVHRRHLLHAPEAAFNIIHHLDQAAMAPTMCLARAPIRRLATRPMCAHKARAFSTTTHFRSQAAPPPADGHAKRKPLTNQQRQFLSSAVSTPLTRAAWPSFPLTRPCSSASTKPANSPPRSYTPPKPHPSSVDSPICDP